MWWNQLRCNVILLDITVAVSQKWSYEQQYLIVVVIVLSFLKYLRNNPLWKTLWALALWHGFHSPPHWQQRVNVKTFHNPDWQLWGWSAVLSKQSSEDAFPSSQFKRSILFSSTTRYWNRASPHLYVRELKCAGCALSANDSLPAALKGARIQHIKREEVMGQSPRPKCHIIGWLFLHRTAGACQRGLKRARELERIWTLIGLSRERGSYSHVLV